MHADADGAGSHAHSLAGRCPDGGRRPGRPPAALLPAVSAPLPYESTVLAASADGRRPRILPSLYFSLVVLQGADLYSTHATKASGASELNPLLNTVGGGMMGQTAVKAALTTSSIFLAERLWRKNKRGAAVVAMVSSNSLMAVVVRHNMQNAGR